MSSARISYPDRTREEVLAALREQVRELAGRFPVEKAVLFGSYATDDFTVASDVDLLLAYRGQRRGTPTARSSGASTSGGSGPTRYPKRSTIGAGNMSS